MLVSLKVSDFEENFQFASAVAEFEMLLRDSKHKSDLSYEQVIEIAKKKVRRPRNSY
jgi:hypothetical protein